MNLGETFGLRRSAQREAIAGVDSRDAYVVSVQGPRPQFDPVGYLEHARVGRDLNNHSDIEELEHDRTAAEDELTRHPSPTALGIVLIFLFALETIGCTFVMRALGYENPERVLVGLMLAAFVFFITMLAARNASGGRWFYGVLVAYGVLVLAVATLRFDEVASQDGGSTAGDWAASALMLFVTVGPAWLAETLMRRRAAGAKIAKELRNLRRRIRRATKAHSKAERFVDQLARKGTRWDEGAAQRRAFYDRVHRLAIAEKGRLKQGQQS